MSAFGWYFPSTGKGESDGFMDAQLEHFQWNHENYVAREAIQNAIDAKIDNGLPVRVEFQISQMPIAEFPSSDEFFGILENCLTYNEWQEEATKFFSSAKKLMCWEYLSVLRIWDYNTCGLTGGDNDDKWNWHRLVKASWTSSSKGATWWSFWIGKWAPIAASWLRTVFYSTKTQDGVGLQWKARLTSFVNEKEDTLRGVGFYSSLSENSSIRDESLFPKLFKRNEIWTDIFIMGYENMPNWEYKLAESVIQNFWLPIHSRDLVVTIISQLGQKAEINAESLLSYIDELGSRNTDFPSQVLPFINAYTLSDEVFSENLKLLGDVKLFVKKSESYPREVMMARKPKILVQKKRYRVLRENYAAVFLCTNEEGNKILREMEPPAHDEWSADRNSKNGKNIWRGIDDFIKDSLKSMAALVEDSAQDVPWLDRFLPDVLDEDESFWNSAIRIEHSSETSNTESPREVPRRQSVVLSTISDQSQGSTKSNLTKPWNSDLEPAFWDGTSTSSKDGNGSPSGEDDAEGNVSGQITSDEVSFRSFMRELGDYGRIYQFALNAKQNCHWDMSIIAVGDDATTPIAIHSATDSTTWKPYVVIGSKIKDISIEVWSTKLIQVCLIGDHRYALTLSKHEA
jgi:hypothetical protein